jgi:hypothetical protein
MCKLVVFPVLGGVFAFYDEDHDMELWDFETGHTFAIPWTSVAGGPRGKWWSSQQQVGGDKGEYPYSTLLPVAAGSY